MKKHILIPKDFIDSIGKEKYWEFNNYIRKKYKLKKDECFWLVCEINKDTILT